MSLWIGFWFCITIYLQVDIYVGFGIFRGMSNTVTDISEFDTAIEKYFKKV